MKKRVVIVGGGSTGCATAHDLTLRGFEVVLVERGELASGTTGRCSCFLHSGARYAVKDQESAIECIEENKIIRTILPPRTMEENGGVFILLEEDDPSYADRFFEGCAACGIPAEEIEPRLLLAMEPNLTKRIRRAAIIPDAIVEALRFALSFAATAKINGATILRFTELEALMLDGSRVAGVRVQNRCTGERYAIEADLVVNAAGPWANKIARLAGVDIPLSLSPGIHVILNKRLSHFVVNRMHMPGSGDFVAPLGQSSILGTSSWTVQDPDYLHIPRDHVQKMRDACAELIPQAKNVPAKAINAASRPLLAAPGKSERELSRTFKCFDHLERDNVDGLVTIAGGKLATARAMAQAVADLTCRKLEVEAPCQTHTFPLVSYRRLYTG